MTNRNFEARDIHEKMAYGRVLRAQAFRDAFLWIANGVRNLTTPTATSQERRAS